MSLQYHGMHVQVLPYVAVVLDQPAIGPDWRSWFITQMAHNSVFFNLEEGSFWDRSRGDDIIGWFQLLEEAETERVLETTRVQISARDCPWIDLVRIRGALSWFPVVGEEMEYNFIPQLLPLCRGPVIRTKDGAHYEWIRQVTFSMDNLLSSKGGFNEGAAFLDKSPDSEYLRYCRHEAQAVLDQAGLEAQVYICTEDFHPNPLRVGELFYKNRKYFRRASEWVLKDLYVAFWAYDWKWEEDKSFWFTEY